MKDKHASPRYAVSADKQSQWFHTMSEEEREEWKRKCAEGMKRWRDGKARLKASSGRKLTE